MMRQEVEVGAELKTVTKAIAAPPTGERLVLESAIGRRFRNYAGDIVKQRSSSRLKVGQKRRHDGVAVIGATIDC